MRKLLSGIVMVLVLAVSVSVRADVLDPTGPGISATGDTGADLVPGGTQPTAGSIQAHRQEMQYLAQQRSIRAMAEALMMKKGLDILGSVHHDYAAPDRVKNQYSNTKSTLATLAGRRGLYNSLLTFKYQIATIRSRLRAEAMEMDVLPVATPVEVVASPTIYQGPRMGRTAGN